MKKLIGYCALCAALSVGLAGCSGSGSENRSDSGRPADSASGLDSTSTLDSNGPDQVLALMSVGHPLSGLEGFTVRALATPYGVRVVASSERQGVVIADAQGKILAQTTSGDSKSIDVREDNNGSGFWVSHVDEKDNTVALGFFDPRVNVYQSVRWDQSWNQTVIAACLSKPDFLQAHELMVWVVTEEGMAYQQLLSRQVLKPGSPQDPGVQAQSVRAVALGEGVNVCAVDDQQQTFYWSQSNIGLLSMNSDEEKDEQRRLLAAVQPVGELEAAPSDLQVLRHAGVLTATVAESALVQLYSLSGEKITQFGIDAAAADAVTSVALLESEATAEGSLKSFSAQSANTWQWWAMADEGQQLLSATTMALATLPPRMHSALPTYTVYPLAQTDMVHSYGDAADDPEIWVNRQNPEASLILATDKQQGLWVYDLQGRAKQLLQRGKLNNVDLRYDFALSPSKTVDLAMATSRTTNNLDLFAIDTDTGAVSLLTADVIDSSIIEPYGGCLYQSKTTHQTYAFVNNKDGLYQQWALSAEVRNGQSIIQSRKVREFTLKGQPEGCVADDETGLLYVGEEDHGLWMIGAEADDATDLRLIDSVAGGRLVADVEGISLYAGADGEGFVVVSSQGDNAYVLYDRKTHAYAGRFRVRANADLGIDGSSETDGLAVSSVNLGGDFGRGLLVVQDGRNRMPSSRQNFKLVSWDAVEKGLNGVTERAPAAQADANGFSLF